VNGIIAGGMKPFSASLAPIPTKILFPKPILSSLLTMPYPLKVYPASYLPYESKNGLPLLPIHCEGRVTAPLLPWGSVARTTAFSFGTYHFYTDDHKFEGLWSVPEKILISDCINFVEPDFTIIDDYRCPALYYQLYRRRWLSCKFAELGKKIIINISVRSQELVDYLLTGVPSGWSSFATRGSSLDIETLTMQYQAIKQVCATPKLLIYGGSAAVSNFALNNEGCFYSPLYRGSKNG